MIKSLKSVFAVLLLSTLTTTAYAGISVGADSDYMYRGVSQTDGSTSAWASADWSHDSGIYLGAWLGQVDYADGSDLETDLVAGWSNDWLNVGYIDYSYNGDTDLDGSEIFIGSEIMGVSVEYYMGQDDYTDYLEFGYSVMGLDVSYGMWDEVGDNMKISKSFDLPMDLEGSLSFVQFLADDGSMMDDEDTIVFGIAKSF
jgi:uncharacterized protein (TIGR02001 family)|tara:strand:+ start:2684 stop:3283 length:600 start_codon:yes stop_codon:yes gene_type:complete